MAACSDPILNITTYVDFENLVNSSSKDFIVIKFSKNDCNPCKNIKPKFDELTINTNYSKIAFVEINKSELTIDGLEIISEYGIKLFPSFLILSKGDFEPKYDVLIGSESFDELKRLLDLIMIDDIKYDDF